jgi:serine/threonine protein kinase
VKRRNVLTFLRPFDGQPSEATRLFCDALKGIRFLHYHGWIHRYLRPSKIGIRRNRAVILDMKGAILASSVASEEPPTRVFARPLRYAAPERETKEYDFAVDVWSMGVILYKLIFGYHPWKWTSPIISGEDHNRVEFLSRYSRAMEHMGTTEEPWKRQGNAPHIVRAK